MGMDSIAISLWRTDVANARPLVRQQSPMDWYSSRLTAGQSVLGWGQRPKRTAEEDAAFRAMVKAYLAEDPAAFKAKKLGIEQ